MQNILSFNNSDFFHVLFGGKLSITSGDMPQLKAGYHTDSRCQYQPASFSSVFTLSGTACHVGVGDGGAGFPPQIGDM